MIQNSILNLFERQYGNYFSQNYDTTLYRLAAHRDDCWRGVAPSTHGPLFNLEPPVLAAKFAKKAGYQNIIAIANEDGMVAVQDVFLRNQETDEQPLDGEQCHFNAVFDLEWMPDAMKLISVSGDHTARLWELTESKLVESRVFQGHSRSVKTAAFRKMDSAVFATGGRDGSILIWDTRASLSLEMASRADNCIFSGHAGVAGPRTPVSHRKKHGTRCHTPKLPANVSSSSITGLVFQDDNTLISCGAGDGLIKVWDMRRNYTAFKKEPTPKHSLPYAGTSTFMGFTNLLIDNSGLKLYASCMDNTIYCYNIATYEGIIQKYTGATIGSFYVKSCLSPDSRYLISGSTYEKAYVWNTTHSEPILTLNGHTQEVTCVAWTQTRENAIVTCSDDARHKIWRIPSEEVTSEVLADRYRGTTTICERNKSCFLTKTTVTPRSGKKIVRNECTPTTRNSVKRPYTSISDDFSAGNDTTTRGNVSESEKVSKGRRLFSPLASTSRAAGGIQCLEITKGLEIIFEDVPDAAMSPQKNRTSPLSERPNLLLSPENSSNLMFSPTSNLPNYVIDGEAPHLRVSSPKRKLKENVDWLTKIRKQKILSLGLSNNIEKLTTEESTTTKARTPKRRYSGCDSPTMERQPKTPRRSSTAEMSILRFLTITPTTSSSK